jgi:EAL domain-containing protein (putative c-di-GMP-specific phosphodiesterase class I)
VNVASAGEGLQPVFQPIVSLHDDAVVGFEALARWPHLGDPDPEDVFVHAARIGGDAALERKAIDAAIDAALTADLPTGSAVLINCEATTPHITCAEDPVLARGADRLRLIFELTERSLLTHTANLLRKVADLRADGFAIALDDVGANVASLALLDVIAPDIIKLDMGVVQSLPRYQQARTWAAVLAHHERAGATILAEGIETAEHLRRARALGATLVQGFMFGHPAPLTAGRRDVSPWPAPERPPYVDPGTGSLFDLVASDQTRRERKDTVLALSRYLERQAADSTDPPMVLTALQRAEFFSGSTRRHYHHLAAMAPLVVVFGQDLPADLGQGIRGVPLTSDDPLGSHWVVLFLGANIAAALIAREVLDGADGDGERLFDVALTNDRTRVTTAAWTLLTRMVNAPPAGDTVGQGFAI